VLDFWHFFQQHRWSSLQEELSPNGQLVQKRVVNWAGCGGGIRRDLRDKIGFYEEWGMEAMFERTLSVKILDEGYSIESFSDIYVYHRWSANGEPAACRLAREALFTGCRSTALFFLKYFPAKLMIHQLWRLTYDAVFACIEQKTTLYLWALLSAAQMSPAVWRDRQVINPAILNLFHIPFNFKGK
jgi:hypothetical protein